MKNKRRYIVILSMCTILGGSIYWKINGLKNQNVKLQQNINILKSEKDNEENIRYLAEKEIEKKFDEIRSKSVDVTIYNKISKPIEFIYMKDFTDAFLWFDGQRALPYKAKSQYEIKCDYSKVDRKINFEEKIIDVNIPKSSIFIVNYNPTREDADIVVRMVGDPIRMTEEEIKEKGIKETNWVADLDQSTILEMEKEYRNAFEKCYSKELITSLSKKEEQDKINKKVIMQANNIYGSLGFKLNIKIIDDLPENSFNIQ